MNSPVFQQEILTIVFLFNYWNNEILIRRILLIQQNMKRFAPIAQITMLRRIYSRCTQLNVMILAWKMHTLVELVEFFALLKSETIVMSTCLTRIFANQSAVYEVSWANQRALCSIFHSSSLFILNMAQLLHNYAPQSTERIRGKNTLNFLTLLLAVGYLVSMNNKWN